MEGFVNICLGLVAIYLMAGVVFYLVFFASGLQKIDTEIQGTSLGFKLIIAPGVILLWPLLLRKWISKK